MTFYALCPNCEKTIEDTGKTRFITCSKCGRTIVSRVYDKTISEDSQEHEVYSLSKKQKVDSSLRHSGTAIMYNPMRAVGGFLCLVAIVCVISFIIINIIAFFPAIYLTAPELLNEQQIDLETEIPLTIDDSPPEITNIQQSNEVYYPGELVTLTIELEDPHLMEAKIQMENKDYLFKYDRTGNKYSTSFQAPAKSGNYTTHIFAKDFAGNIKTKNLNLQVINRQEPYLILTSLDQYSFVNTTSTLNFTLENPQNMGISRVFYTLDGNGLEYNITYPYSISPTGWLEGRHTLNLSIISYTGEFYNLSLNILVDYDKPGLNGLSINPLTINRKETFEKDWTKKVFYRGELVDFNINITEKHLESAYININKNLYNLIPVRDNQLTRNQTRNTYHTIFSMPTKPGKYEITILTNDLAGNVGTKDYKIDIARVNFNYQPVPILEIISDTGNLSINLPVINSSTSIDLTIEYGYINEVKFLNNNSGWDLERFEDEPINFNSVPEGDGRIEIRATNSYNHFDYLFISLPVPPYLFVLPGILTGWSLFGFFIFIAVVIILSNLYLFKSSFSGALKQIKYAIENVRAPMMESNNAMIMLAQLFLAVVSFTVIYNQILAWGQVPTNTPDFSSLSNWAYIYSLTSASVYEEIISRLLLIGIPLFIIHALTGKLKDPKRNYILGGGFEINRVTIALIIFSAITFGLAHAPGWDYWKVIPTVIAGFALGYLFVKKGIFASILLHFTINFLNIPFLISGYPVGAYLLFSLIFLFRIIMGLVYIRYYTSRIFSILRKNPSTSS